MSNFTCAIILLYGCVSGCVFRDAKTSESRAGKEQSPKAVASAAMQSQDILEVKVNVSDLKDGQ